MKDIQINNDMDLLTPGVGLVFWQVVVFVLLILLLAKMAWKPILRALKEREDFIRESLDAAETAKQEMAALKADNEKLLQEAYRERDKILTEARDEALRLHDKAQVESKKNAEKIIDNARTAIDTAKHAALRDVRSQIAVLSLEIAEKLMRKNLSQDDAQRELINRFVNELKSN